jgi:hypothetical protein
MRKSLSKFYGVLKSCENSLGHVFITGVSRFTKTSLFSELNNLIDLTYEPAFSDVCGLNSSEFEELLEERHESALKSLTKKNVMKSGSDKDDLRNLIMDWYDGYSWDGTTRVLNPWSVFSFFDGEELGSFWYETGTPSFLLDLAKTSQMRIDIINETPKFREEDGGKNQFLASDFAIGDVSLIDPKVLLFQTGYLTVKEIIRDAESLPSYRLGLPNLEVEAALVPLALSIEPPLSPSIAKRSCRKAFESLFNLDLPGFEEAFSVYLFKYPYVLHEASEKYYHSLLLAALMLADVPFRSEGLVGEGRFDASFAGPGGDVFIIEVKYVPFAEDPAKEPDADQSGRTLLPEDDLSRKMAKKAREALKQIDDKYVKNFLGGENKIRKVGLVVAGRTKVLAMMEEQENICSRPSPTDDGATVD